MEKKTVEAIYKAAIAITRERPSETGVFANMYKKRESFYESISLPATGVLSAYGVGLSEKRNVEMLAKMMFAGTKDELSAEEVKGLLILLIRKEVRRASHTIETKAKNKEGLLEERNFALTTFGELLVSIDRAWSELLGDDLASYLQREENIHISGEEKDVIIGYSKISLRDFGGADISTAVLDGKTPSVFHAEVMNFLRKFPSDIAVKNLLVEAKTRQRNAVSAITRAEPWRRKPSADAFSMKKYLLKTTNCAELGVEFCEEACAPRTAPFSFPSNPLECEEEKDSDIWYPSELSVEAMFFSEFARVIDSEWGRDTNLDNMLEDIKLSQAEVKGMVNRAFFHLSQLCGLGGDDFDDFLEKNPATALFLVSSIVCEYTAAVIEKDRRKAYKALLAKPAQKQGSSKKKGSKDDAYGDLYSENKALKAELLESERKIKRETEKYRQAEADARKKAAEAKAEKKALEKRLGKEIAEKDAEIELLRELLRSAEVEEQIVHRTEEEFLECIKGKRVLIWGMRKEIADKINYDEIVCLSTDKKSKDMSLTKERLLGYDAVIISTNHTNHSSYFKVVAMVKDAGIPYRHVHKYTNNVERFKDAVCDALKGASG